MPAGIDVDRRPKPSQIPVSQLDFPHDGFRHGGWRFLDEWISRFGLTDFGANDLAPIVPDSDLGHRCWIADRFRSRIGSLRIAVDPIVHSALGPVG